MCHEIIRFLKQADVYQDRIDRAGLRKHGKEQHCKGGSHDQVRKINDCLEESLELQLQLRIRKPGTKQERQKNLRNEAKHPHDHGILEILQKVSLRQKLNVILQSDKVRTDLFQSGHITFKETVIDRCHQRNQLEHNKYDHKRDQKDIAPAVIPDDRAFFLTLHNIGFSICL